MDKLGDCKRGLSSLIRPHYTEGLLLQDDDLTAGVTYTRALSRLMFRTLFGCGVLCGLRVSDPRERCGKLEVEVARGVALDCVGDPVELPTTQVVGLDECAQPIGTELWIGLRLNEKCCAPRTAVCSPDDDEAPSVCTRERDGFELCVFANRPPCSCGCAPRAAPTPTIPTTETAPAPAPADAGAVTPPPGVDAVAASPSPPRVEPRTETGCLCNQRTGPGACHEKFYQGDCACDCCDCEWIVLAVITRPDAESDDWKVDHSVRRFVRPVLMRDPLAP